MRVLRKTGVRAPWQPAPLAEVSPFVRAAAVTVVAAAIALPGATVWMPRPLDAGVVAQPDNPPHTQIIVGQQPTPDARTFLTYALRVPNADPLRPLLVQAEPPDAGLVQPSTLLVGRLPRPEDTAWPARPAHVQGVPVPLPGAASWLPAPLRPANTDPLRPPWVVAEPLDATVVQAQAVPLGRLARPEDTTTPLRPITALIGAAPTPPARAALLAAPRDQAAPLPDPLRPPWVVPGWQPVPGAGCWAAPLPRSPNTDPLRVPILRPDAPAPTIQQPSALWVGRPAIVEDTNTLPRPPQLAGWRATPSAAQAAWAGAPRPVAVALPDRLSPPALILGQQPTPSAGLWQPLPLHSPNTDPLRPIVLVAEPPDPTLVQPSALLLGRLPRAEDTSRPPRLLLLISGAQPQPAALVLAGTAPRLSVVAAPERAGFAPHVISPAVSPPVATVRSTGLPLVDAPAVPGRAPIVLRPAELPIGAVVTWLPAWHIDTIVPYPLHSRPRPAALHSARPDTLHGARAGTLSGSRAGVLHGRRAAKLTKRRA